MNREILVLPQDRCDGLAQPGVEVRLFEVEYHRAASKGLRKGLDQFLTDDGKDRPAVFLKFDETGPEALSCELQGAHLIDHAEVGISEVADQRSGLRQAFWNDTVGADPGSPRIREFPQKRETLSGLKVQGVVSQTRVSFEMGEAQNSIEAKPCVLSFFEETLEEGGLSGVDGAGQNKESTLAHVFGLTWRGI